jgi:hypothetical protein
MMKTATLLSQLINIQTTGSRTPARGLRAIMDHEVPFLPSRSTSSTIKEEPALEVEADKPGWFPTKEM